MQQYLLSIYGPDAPPPPDVVARMDQIMANVNALVDEAKAAGAWVFNAGLHPPSTATVVRLSHGDILMTDGPYAEGKEHIGGFLIVKAPDLDAALIWARKLAGVLGNGVDSLPVEVRPFQGDSEDA
ncbi:MAG: YciI family protein [Chloroflexota bacterium]|nr:YciI family protein [Chloroflexota bacterium]